MKRGRLVLLTGGIGAGKSVVARVLRLKGYEVYDTDTEAKRIMNSDPVLRRRITEHWGEEAYAPSGTLDRKFVASKIFGQDEERLWLNSLVHGIVSEDMLRHAERSEGIMFVECALPSTSGIAGLVDYIWLVDAPEAVRVARASNRDASPKEAVKARIAAQREEFEGMPPEKTAVIVNDGGTILQEIEYLLEQQIEIEKQK